MAKPSVRRDNPFRLNFEQQKKRAKELLRSHEEEEPEAQRRVLAHLPGCDTPRLADAQFVIARELGLASWPALKAHIEAMDRARRTSSARASRAPPPSAPTRRSSASTGAAG